jgi:hypothetical protein
MPVMRRKLTWTSRDAFTHRPGWVIGGPVFRYYYSIWNGRDLKMSFAKPIWKL